MRNNDRVDFAVIGSLVGGIVGVMLLPLFILGRIDPMFWFALTIFVLAPLGAFIGWSYAGELDNWLSRGEKK